MINSQQSPGGEKLVVSGAPLGKYPSFMADTPDELCAAVESVLHARCLEPVNAAVVRARANRYSLPSTELWFCSYGTPMTLRFSEGDFIRVQFRHAGTGYTYLNQEPQAITPDLACVTDASAVIHFPADFEQVVWRIPKQVIASTLTALTGARAAAPSLDPRLALDTPQGRLLLHTLRATLAAVDITRATFSTTLLAELEQALLVAFLNGGQCDRLLAEPHVAAASRQLRRAEEYIDANWNSPILLEDLAAVAGVSIRSLNRAFRAGRKCSPMEFVRQRRLQRARDSLLREPGLSITEVALACGFADASHFSKAYSRAFGVSPRSSRKLSPGA